MFVYSDQISETGDDVYLPSLYGTHPTKESENNYKLNGLKKA